MTGGDVAIFDTETYTSRTEVSAGFALVLIVAVLSTLVLDAYAFSTFVGS
jgi:hypothetical protein